MTVLVMGFSSVTSMAANPLNPPQMGGDERLACEALMCLVNPASQPSECQSALKKFHSIKHKHGHDTITARRNFLKKCPAQDRSGFDDFIDSIIK